MSLALARRPAGSQTILEVRSLTPADLKLLRQPTAKVHTKTLRDRHHHMAWLVALGKPVIEIAAECRISPTRLSMLKSTPAFAELITRYRNEIEASRLEAAREFGAAAVRNMALAEGLITEQLEAAKDDPDLAPSIRDLNRIATDRMDRFGYPKKTLTDSRSVNLNFAASLEAAIARSKVAE